MIRRHALPAWAFATVAVVFLASVPACTNRVRSLSKASGSSTAGTGIAANDLRILVSEPQAVELAESESPEQASARYARLGELLLLPEGLLHADHMFDKALAADPRNAKANFYGALTKIAIAFGGAVPLLEGIAVEEEVAALSAVRRAVDHVGVPELRSLILSLPRGITAFESREQAGTHLDREILPVLVDSSRRLERAHSRAPFMVTIDADRLRMSAGPMTRILGRNPEDCRYTEGEGWACTIDPSAALPEPVAVAAEDVTRVQDSVEAVIEEIRSGSNPDRAPDLARLYELVAASYREALAVLDGN